MVEPAVDENDIGQCFNCAKWVPSGAFCYVCREYVCGTCEASRSVAAANANHTSGDHLRVFDG